MKAAVLRAYNTPLEIEDVQLGDLGPREVLVRTAASGVCHSDLHIWQGYFDLGNGKKITVADRGVEPPFTLGHEIAGEVAAVGPEATGVEVGVRRVVYPWIGCGSCDACQQRDDGLLCETPRTIGTRRDGGYSDHVIVPHPRYLIDFEGLPEDCACTYACSGLTAYSAIKKFADLGESDSIVFIGAGGVGLSAVLLAPAMIDAKVIVADIDPVKREAAREAGADHVIDNGAADALATVRELTGGGAQAAIDFFGGPASVRFALAALRRGLFADAGSAPPSRWPPAPRRPGPGSRSPRDNRNGPPRGSRGKRCEGAASAPRPRCRAGATAWPAPGSPAAG